MDFLLLLLIPLYIFLDSAVSLYRLQRIYSDYLEWLEKTHASNIHLRQKKSQLKQLIAHANVSDAIMPVVEQVETNFVMSSNVSALDNFPIKHQRISTALVTLINDAIGVYKARMWNAFNPLWWINTLVFLPRSICTYLNVKSDSFLVKVAQILWWVVGTMFTIYKLLFPDNLTRLAQEIYHTLLP